MDGGERPSHLPIYCWRKPLRPYANLYSITWPRLPRVPEARPREASSSRLISCSSNSVARAVLFVGLVVALDRRDNPMLRHLQQRPHLEGEARQARRVARALELVAVRILVRRAWVPAAAHPERPVEGAHDARRSRVDLKLLEEEGSQLGARGLVVEIVLLVVVHPEGAMSKGRAASKGRAMSKGRAASPAQLVSKCCILDDTSLSRRVWRAGTQLPRKGRHSGGFDVRGSARGLRRRRHSGWGARGGTHARLHSPKMSETPAAVYDCHEFAASWQARRWRSGHGILEPSGEAQFRYQSVGTQGARGCRGRGDAGGADGKSWWHHQR